MIWKEKGVLKGSHLCYFHPSAFIRDHFITMVSCGSFICDQDYSVKKEGNRHPIFFFIQEGALSFEYGQERFSAKAGEMVLLNGYHPHRYYCEKHTEFLFFHFDGPGAPELVDHLIQHNGSALFRLPNSADILRQIDEPITRLCHQEQANDATVSAPVYEVLCRLPQGDENVSLYIPAKLQLAPDSISYRVIRYVNTHIDRMLSVQELADHVNLSRHYFMRLFRKETGYSPQEYVSIAKINYAKLMLRTTALSISEIAEHLGYASSASFINAFRLRRGISPNQYRKEEQ